MYKVFIKGVFLFAAISIVLSFLIMTIVMATNQTTTDKHKAPKLMIEKKIEESTVTQNSTFTVQVLFNNVGNAIASAIFVKDTIPDSAIVEDGNNTWFTQQVQPGQGDGFVYKLTPTKKGYLNLGRANAIYKDSNNVSYFASSNLIEVYVEPLTPPTLFDFLDKYSKEFSIAGSAAGGIATVYAWFKKTKNRKPEAKENVRENSNTNKDNKTDANGNSSATQP